jgi:anti-sigma-K factor RskA
MSAHEQYREDMALHAVGALTPEESQRLEAHLRECPDCREELHDLQAAAAQIALAVEPVASPAHLREQLMARLEAQAPQRVQAPVGQTKPSGRPSEGRGTWFWVPAFAAVVLALGLVALWTQNRGLMGQNQELSSKLAENRATLLRANKLISTFTAADTQRITLTTSGAKVQPEAKGVYSSREGGLVLLADHMNALPPNKVYELWLLPADGSAPVPAGTFKPDESGKAALVRAQFGGGTAAKGFALTIENEPGATTPTMPIIMSGTV